MTGTAAAVVQVSVNGGACPAPQRLRSVRVASRLAQPAQCELRFDCSGEQPEWPAGWTLGSGFTVRVAGHDEDLFTGEVTCVELVHDPDGAAELRVRGYDPLHRLRSRQHLRVFEEVTAAELADRLTSDLGVSVEAAAPGPRLDRVLQHRQSDLELLCDISAEAGLYPVLEGRRLRLLTLAGHGDPVALVLGRSLWSLRVSENLDRVPDRVTALGWHSQRGEFTSESASAPRGDRASTLRSGVDGERYLTNLATRDREQLAAVARASVQITTGRAVTIEGTADGDPRLRAGRRIAVAGVPSTSSGHHVLGEVVHTVDGGGYQTSFVTGPPPARTNAADPAGTVVTLGRVTAVDDPRGWGRVRVSLPALGDLDAGWLAVLCPGAGPERGLVVLPDTGDTVVVAMPGANPVDGIVLGSIYGTVVPPDSGVDGNRVRRWSLHTAGGQSVVVDDARRSLRLANRAGSTVELGPDLLRLHAATDLVIEAPGRAITVRADSVDFQRAS